MKLGFKPVIFLCRNFGRGFGIRLDLYRTANDVVSTGVKRPDREAGHSPQLGVEVNAGSSASVYSVVIMAGILVKRCGNRERVARQRRRGAAGNEWRGIPKRHNLRASKINISNKKKY
jgi:hypothetical protein